MTGRLLHIANGGSVTMTLDPIAVPGDRMVWCDPLHDGPVPGGIPDRELWAIRAGFLASAGPSPSEPDPIVKGFEAADAKVAASGQYDEVILWYEHDLFDQLNLIQLLNRLSQVSPRPDVRLICIDRHPNHPRFKGLGELPADELTALLPDRVPVTDAQYAIARRAWSAFRSDDPRDIEACLAEDTSALPFLAPALRRHLEEFPWTTTGLSRRQSRALALIAAGHQTTWNLFRQFDEADEHVFYASDLSLWYVLQELASSDPPLLHMASPSDTTQEFPNVTVTLTSSANPNTFATRGTKRWLGGVLISGRGAHWQWHPMEKRLIHA